MSLHDIMLEYFEKPEINNKILAYIASKKMNYEDLDDE